jgi:hypothetical protein
MSIPDVHVSGFMKSFQWELPVALCTFHSWNMRDGAASVHGTGDMTTREQVLGNHGIVSCFFSFLNVFLLDLA